MTHPIVVERADWGAKFSPGTRPMPGRLSEVNIHHSVTRASRHDPCGDMRQIERILHSRGLDPGYSACIHPTGVILIGAGDKIGKHTKGRNSKSYGICFIGDFTRDHPTWDALQSAGWLINLLRFTGKLVPQLGNITIQPHSATSATACPGENLRNRIEAIRYFAGLPEVSK